VEVNVHLGVAQGGEVLANVGLGDVGPGHQEADHETWRRGPCGSRRPPRCTSGLEQGGRRHLPVQQRIEPLVGRSLEGEGGLFRGEHCLQGLHGGEVAAGVIAHPTGTPARSAGPRTGGLGRHHDGAGSYRICGGDEAAGRPGRFQAPAPSRRSAPGAAAPTSAARPLGDKHGRGQRAGRLVTTGIFGNSLRRHGARRVAGARARRPGGCRWGWAITSGSHFATVQALEAVLAPEQATLTFQGPPNERLDALAGPAGAGGHPVRSPDVTSRRPSASARSSTPRS